MVDIALIDPTKHALSPDSFSQHEHVYQITITPPGQEPSIGYIAIHDTTRGPSLGGIRIRPYATPADALTDALRLSAAMTNKAAAADLELGGGKAVFIGDPRTVKSDYFYKAIAEALNMIGGAYIGAEDSGTSVPDLDAIAQHTPYVVGTSAAWASANPSPATAQGVYVGMKTTLARYKRLTKPDSLWGVGVMLQGIGNVGYSLLELLARDEAAVLIADVDEKKVSKAKRTFGATPVSPSVVHQFTVDVYAPTAFGQVLNETTISELGAHFVIGAANNQLATPQDAQRLKNRGIIYIPDYVVNAGGLINVYHELEAEGYNPEQAFARIAETIARTVKAVLDTAEQDNITTDQAAQQLSTQRLAKPTPRQIYHLGKQPYRWQSGKLERLTT